MKWVLDDGGREAAGYKGETRDCVTRAIAIATALPYAEVYKLVNQYGAGEKSRLRGKFVRSSARTGVYKETTRAIMAQLGWRWVPTMSVGRGCTVHLKPDELPSGTIIVKLSGHVACVKDGVLYDSFDCSRDGTRCVYGYWKKS